MADVSSPPRPYGIPPPVFRLPDGTHPGDVHLQVADLARSLEYYTRVIGLRVIDRDGTSASLGPHGDERVLVRLRERAGVHPVPHHGAFGLYHFAILLPDRASLGRFATHLTRVPVGRVAMADHFVSEAIYCWDPDGLGIEIYADRPRETWRHFERELVMGTEPLKVDALMRAGGERMWDGAPAGTRMGHVHLHVGNLDRAEAFYHAALGFDKTVWTYPGALFLSAGGYHHHLGTNTWSRGPSARDDQARLLEWTLEVPGTAEAAAAAASLRGAGHFVEETSAGWLVDDPWGTRLHIIAS